MPLLLMCGLPASGKTQRASAIASYLTESGRQVVMLDDSNVSPTFDRNLTYTDATQEKELRGQFLSAVQRKLSKTKVLIVDSLNYIKSVRYEFYCAAKSAQTTFAVVYCECSPDIAAQRNQTEERVSSGKAYSPETLQSVIERFEPPEATNRWDSPLIVISPDSADMPLEAIEIALFKNKPAKQNKATMLNPVANTNVSYDIDRITQEIISAYTAQHSSEQSETDILSLKIPSHAQELHIRCKSVTGIVPDVSPSALQRHRRDFIAQFRSKTHLQAATESANIPQLFVAFLESRLFPGLVDHKPQ